MRQLLIIAAAALLLSPLVASGQDRGGWRGGGFDRYQMADRDRDHGDGRGRYEDRGRYDDARRYYDGGQERYAPPPEPRAGGYTRGAPPPYPAGPPRAWRQGEYLPPMYRGSVVQNPSRYRLRAPPPGYAWVGVGPDIYLMQRGTGMVLDTIPGGY